MSSISGRRYDRSDPAPRSRTTASGPSSWPRTACLAGSGSQHALYSVSDRFFVQAFGERFDAAIRRALSTTPITCGPPASDALRATVPGCPRTTSRDAAGVLTAGGAYGIAADTYDSAAAVNDTFALVRRGALVGERIHVDFQQLGSSAAAAAVAYDVAAAPRPNAWGDVAFALGGKPIGFANSCWKVLVNGGDTGIVLAIGP